jgi:anti-anti-sigma factor
MLKPAVQVRNEGGVLVAEFWDCLRLDPAPVQDLKREFETHLRGKGRPDVVVDLNGVTFAGSAALGMFLAINRQARQKGGRVVFCNVDPGVLEVFRVSKLTPLFQFEADRAKALEAVNRPAGAQSEGPTNQAPAKPDGKPKGSAGSAPLKRARRGTK